MITRLIAAALFIPIAYLLVVMLAEATTWAVRCIGWMVSR